MCESVCVCKYFVLISVHDYKMLFDNNFVVSTRSEQISNHMKLTAIAMNVRKKTRHNSCSSVSSSVSSRKSSLEGQNR